MTHIPKVLIATLSVISLTVSEPPVPSYHGYSSNGYSAPATSYLPPRYDYTSSNGYLPPNAPSNAAASYDDGSNHGHHHHHGHGNDDEVPKSYEFGYSVKDIRSGNDYDRREMSDGNVVRGEYRVQLPDGRTQIVTYHADWLTGYHADVRYEGEASYPEPSHHGYNYNTPEFTGSLTGFHSNSFHQPSSSYGAPGYH